MSDATFYAVAVGSLALIILWEWRVPSFRRGIFGDRRKAVRNWSYLASILVTMVGIRMVSGGMEGAVPRLISLEGLFVLDIAGVFLTAELMNYGIHYLKHRHGYLWRFHFQHHRETDYNIWLTAHLHGLEVFVSGCAMSAVLVLAGFSSLATQIYFLFYSAANTYQHSGTAISLGFLDWLIVSPRYHRLHHAVKMRGNFGSTLTVWDIVFGTAQWPKTKDAGMRTGIRESGEPYGFWSEITYFLRRGRVRSGRTEAIEGMSAISPIRR